MHCGGNTLNPITIKAGQSLHQQLYRFSQRLKISKKQANS